MDNLLKTPTGLVRTSADTAVNPDSISQSGLAQAQNFAKTYNGGFVSSASITQGSQASNAVAQNVSSLVNPQPQPYNYQTVGGSALVSTNSPINLQNGFQTSAPAQQYQRPSAGQSGDGSQLSGIYGVLQNAFNVGADSLAQAHQVALNNAQIASQQLQLSYNTQLGSLNQQYNQAFQQLYTQHQNSVGAAIAQMAVADPFGTNSSSTNLQYVGKINDMYSQQASFLNSAYQQQQVALQNGQVSAALDIQKQINDANSSFGSKLADLQSGLASAVVGATQTQQSRQLSAASAFQSALNSTPLTNLDTSNPDAIKEFLDTSTLGKLGAEAGYSLDQMASMVMQGTKGQISAQKSYADLARTQQEIQLAGAVSNIAGAIASIPSNYGFQYGSDQYLKQALSITGASPKQPPTDVRQKLNSYANVADQLGDVAQAAKDIAGNSAMVNLLNSKTPWTQTQQAQFMSIYQAALNRVAPNIARAVFSETGRLTNFDIQNAINSIGPINTADDARNAILKGTMKLVKSDMYNNLATAAQSGYNVSAFGQAYDSVASKVDQAVGAMGGDKIRVRLNASGQTGTIDPSKFDPATMTKI